MKALEKSWVARGVSHHGVVPGEVVASSSGERQNCADGSV